MPIEPLSSANSDAARRYLRQRSYSDEVIQWKYFDDSFTRGRTRAFLSLDQQAARGFIGVIPSTLRVANERRPFVWSCDWSIAEQDKTPGLGVRILQRAIQQHQHLIAFGGNANTAAILPRLATKTFADGAVDMRLFLRLGGWLSVAARRFSWLRGASRGQLGRIPLKLPRHGESPGPPVQWFDGIPPQLEPLLHAPTGADWDVEFDLEHLRWFLTRCPGIQQATTCLCSIDGSPVAATVIWNFVAEPPRWHLALWHVQGQQSALDAVVQAAVGRINDHRGGLIAAIVGQADAQRLVALEQAGFKRWNTLPFYVCLSGPGAVPPANVGNMCYLASDTSFSDGSVAR